MHANLAIGLSSAVAANLAANNVAGLSRQLLRQPCASITGVFVRNVGKLGGRQPHASCAWGSVGPKPRVQQSMLLGCFHMCSLAKRFSTLRRKTFGP